MKNPLVQTVEDELRRVGIHGAMLIEESYEPREFGNAQAVFDIDGIRLRFVRDRGDDGVDVVVPGSTESFIFEDLSLAMGWQQPDQSANIGGETDRDRPPAGPIPLSAVLAYIRDGMRNLQCAFEERNLALTLKRLRDARTKRTKAMFR